jgi:hypothetical protein
VQATSRLAQHGNKHRETDAKRAAARGLSLPGQGQALAPGNDEEAVEGSDARQIDPKTELISVLDLMNKT